MRRKIGINTLPAYCLSCKYFQDHCSYVDPEDYDKPCDSFEPMEGECPE